MITALLSSRVRKWAITTVAVPVAKWTLDQAAEELERRRGDSGGVRTLRRASGILERVGPKGRRKPAPQTPPAQR